MTRWMRPVIALVIALAGAASPAAAAPVRIVAVDLDVDRSARTVRVSAVVADDPGQVLTPRYRTTLRYRCGSGAWTTAVRTKPGPASRRLRWRYPGRLARRRCTFRVVVAREGDAHAARSDAVERRL